MQNGGRELDARIRARSLISDARLLDLKAPISYDRFIGGWGKKIYAKD